MGIGGYVDDGTRTAAVMGIDRTVAGNEYFQGTVIASVGSGDLEDTIQRAVDQVHINIGGKTQIALMAMKVWRRFANDLKGDRRYVTAAETGKYKGGVNFLMYSGDGEDIPILRHRDVPAGTVWGLNWDSFYWGEMLPPGWLQVFDEKSIFRWVQEFTAWQAIYAQLGELVCSAPAKNWVLRDVTEAA